jgi:hypothetical protein
MKTRKNKRFDLPLKIFFKIQRKKKEKDITYKLCEVVDYVYALPSCLGLLHV